LAGHKLYTLQALEIDPGTLETTRSIVVGQSYNALGQVVSTTAYADTLDGISDLSRESVDQAVGALAGNARNRTTRIAYDATGRERFVVAADGTLSEMQYDAFGQLTETRRFFDVIVAGGTPVTETALAGLVGQRKVGDGSTRGERYTYDTVGRLHTT